MGAAFGVWRSGATLVPLSTFATERELEELVEHADLDALIVQPRLRDRELMPLARQLQGQRATSPRPLRDIIELGLQAAPSGPFPDTSLPTDVACILYTSGTTGRAKGVMLSHAGILSTIFPTAERGGLVPGDTFLSSLPLFWVAGLVIRALPTLASGATLALLETFTAEAALESLRRLNVTGLHLRPPQVGQLVRHPEFDPALLANVRRGGGRSDWFAPHLAEARLITGYGMTEMSGYVTALAWSQPDDERAQQLGRPLPGVEIRIVRADGTLSEADEAGEIQVRGPGLFRGYYKEAEGKGLTADGWFATGDIGSLDAQGVFQFSGRSKDLLRVKGINVSPVEVESLLATHGSVEAAYVIGLPVDGLDQEVTALIVPKGGDFSLEQLRQFAREALSAYKRPSRYVVIQRSEVPLGATSKPQRQALAELAERRRDA